MTSRDNKSSNSRSKFIRPRKNHAFIDAARQGHLEEVDRLLRMGAALNGRYRHRETALMFASQQGHIAIVRLLLDKGANVNAKDEYGWTALMGASRAGHLEVVDCLLSKGANAKVETISGDTALTLAISKGHLEIVNLLQARDHSMSSEKNNWGKTKVDDHQAREDRNWRDADYEGFSAAPSSVSEMSNYTAFTEARGMADSSGVIQLLEGTGLQYIDIKGVSLDDPERNLLTHKELFFRPANHSKQKPPADFNPWMICPNCEASTAGNHIDKQNAPIPHDRLFSVQGDQALRAFDSKWLPLPYTSRLRARQLQEVNCNNWVRLWYHLTTATTADIVLCVDTDASGKIENAGFSGFQQAHLNQTFAANPFSVYFWQSTPLKGWINKLGRDIDPSSELDMYPAYSHFIALLQMLSACGVLPHIQLSDALGDPVDVHLFLDVGNSRTCGIIAERLPGKNLQPESFEKVEVQNIDRPNETQSEPFESTCAFLPSPFDPEFNRDLNWSPNFRIPFVLRVGDVLERIGGTQINQSSLSSPKRYLWATETEPSPWFFAKPASNGQASIVKGEILDFVAEDGSPIFAARGAVPRQPRYPKGSMMTFFVLELLFHALSQINSASYRSQTSQEFSKRFSSR